MNATVAAQVSPLPPDGRQSQTALRIARGARRLLWTMGYSTLTELPLRNGRRADITAIDARSRIVIVEIKSSIADYRADSKWPDYRDHCDELFFAVAPEMPADIMPPDAGLIIADEYGGRILRPAPELRLAAATRREMLVRFAHAAANRLHRLDDPGLRAPEC